MANASTSKAPDNTRPDDQPVTATERATDTAWKADTATPPDRSPYPDSVQQLKGRGRVFRGSEPLSEVDYELTITPAALRNAAAFEPGTPEGGTSKNDGLPDITGRLMGALYEAEKFATGIHTLELEDGQRLDFQVLQPETNEIIGVSWFRSSTPGDTTRTL